MIHVEQGNIRSTQVIAFLGYLRRQLQGRKLILLWDGFQAHRSKQAKRYLARQRRWLEVSSFPAYAPELNPVELIWAYIDNTEMANFTGGLSGIPAQIRRAANRIRHVPQLGRSFIQHAGLLA